MIEACFQINIGTKKNEKKRASVLQTRKPELLEWFDLDGGGLDVRDVRLGRLLRVPHVVQDLAAPLRGGKKEGSGADGFLLRQPPPREIFKIFVNIVQRCLNY